MKFHQRSPLSLLVKGLSILWVYGSYSLVWRTTTIWKDL